MLKLGGSAQNLLHFSSSKKELPPLALSSKENFQLTFSNFNSNRNKKTEDTPFTNSLESRAIDDRKNGSCVKKLSKGLAATCSFGNDSTNYRYESKPTADSEASPDISP